MTSTYYCFLYRLVFLVLQNPRKIVMGQKSSLRIPIHVSICITPVVACSTPVIFSLLLTYFKVFINDQ